MAGAGDAIAAGVWADRAVTSWTSLHVHAGAQISARVHVADGVAVISVDGSAARATLFVPHAELRTLGEVIAQSVAALAAYVPPVVITASASATASGTSTSGTSTTGTGTTGTASDTAV